jgi:EmrB/QacA subfamily drug resistance transporter
MTPALARSEQARPDHAAPEHRHLGLALTIISAAQLMVVLDASIVNVALPSIQRSLHFSPPNLVWVINGYTLAFGGLLLLGGRTGDLFGRRRMFLVGVGLFTFSSLLGGLATTEWWLIGARVLQGLGGAIAAPTALSLIASTFPEGQRRNRAMGVYSSMSGMGGAAGVLLGGVLTDTLSWRWVLFVNVPVGLAVLLAAPRVLGETPSRPGSLDVPGALTATAGMSLLVFGLVHAASTSWGDAWTVLCLCAGALALCGFVAIQARSAHAMMPLELFGNRNRVVAYATMLAIGTAVFSMFYFLTLYMQNILGYSPLRAGLGYLPFTLTIIVVATSVSRAVGRVGTKVPLMAGTLSGAGGLLWLSQAAATGSYAGSVLGPMLLVAGGMAMCFVPLTLTVVAGVRRDQAGIASALLNSGQQVGGSLGLAVLGTVAATVTRGRAAQVAGRFGPGVAHWFRSQPPGPASHLAPAVHRAVNDAYLHGYVTAISVGAGILMLAFVMVSVGIRLGGGRPAPLATGAPVPAGA